MAVGSFMPWLVGPTKTIGHVDWTGLDDTGEGAMLVFTALALVGWVRWREELLSIEARARWLPLVVAVASLLLWVIAFRKAIALSYFEIEAGARPQLGLLVAGFGTLVAVGGGLLALAESRAAPGVGRRKIGWLRRTGPGRAGRPVRGRPRRRGLGAALTREPCDAGRDGAGHNERRPGGRRSRRSVTGGGVVTGQVSGRRWEEESPPSGGRSSVQDNPCLSGSAAVAGRSAVGPGQGPPPRRSS